MANDVLINKENLSTTDRSQFYGSYKDHTLIGKGGFGIVFQAIEKLSGRGVAIKCVQLKIGAEEKMLRELRVHSRLDHDNIVRYHTAWKEPIEYHKERDKNLLDTTENYITSSSNVSNILAPTHRTSNDNVNKQLLPTNVTDDEDSVFIPSSQKHQQSKSMSSSLTHDAASTRNDQTSDAAIEEKKKEVSTAFEYLFIVTNLCQNKSLKDRLSHEYRSINEIDRINALHIFYQILNGVTYLHDKMKTIHHDLKPANILFSLDNDTVKIADFGLSSIREDLVPIENGSNMNENKQAIGTKLYMPPSGERVSFETDIYALGIILFELLYPFVTENERTTVLTNIRKSNIEFPDDFEKKYGNKTLKSLICQLVCHSTNERPTASNLIENIKRILESNDSTKNKDTTVLKIQNVLNSLVVKELSLETKDIQYGVYDTSNKYLLLSDNKKLKLYNIDCELIDEYSSLHDDYKHVGYIQRIVWCESLKQFLILSQRFLFAFTPGEKTKLINMTQIYFIDKFRQNDDLRFVTCTNKHIFINYSYHTIRQYNIPTWFLFREWSKKKLNYTIDDDIRRTTCSTTNDYIAFNVRLDKCKWVIDFRRIDDDLTLLKRIQTPNLGIYHNLQISSHEWLVIDENDKFNLLDIMEEEPKLKIIQTNIITESDIYTRFFGNYFIVPIVKTPDNTELNENNTSQGQGIICFYQWE